MRQQVTLTGRLASNLPRWRARTACMPVRMLWLIRPCCTAPIWPCGRCHAGYGDNTGIKANACSVRFLGSPILSTVMSGIFFIRRSASEVCHPVPCTP